MNQAYNIYCDESCHLEHDGIKPMGLGCVWCAKEDRLEIFEELRDLKTKHSLKPHCELKWNAVSPAKIDYYIEVVNYFFANPKLHFRALIVADKSQLKHDDFGQSHDEFYYKMYFNLLKTIIVPGDYYEVYIDIKDTQSEQKVKKLKEVISNTHYDFDQSMIRRIQQVDSKEVELVQLTDLLLGAIVYFQRGLDGSQAKLNLINLLKKKSGYSLTRSTLYKEDKFNLFFWRPKP